MKLNEVSSITNEISEILSRLDDKDFIYIADVIIQYLEYEKEAREDGVIKVHGGWSCYPLANIRYYTKGEKEDGNKEITGQDPAGKEVTDR